MKYKLESALIFVSLALILSIGCTKGCSGSNKPEGAPTGQVSELKIEDLKVGDGAEATSGHSVTVHYTGTLTDGSKFDSSVDRGTPFTFNLGAGQVIPGWDKGIVGMKVHGKRKLTIPSDMAYGPQGHPPVIPPYSTLVFEVELLSVN